MSGTPLNLHRIPLRGRQLVESSAGTGKTYAIASLFVRLLLQAGLGVSEILVVTFTEAATEDLRVRIRKRVNQALAALDEPAEDDFLSEFVSRLPDREQARAVLWSALQSFDETAILTIHGFCQRILQENAFESSSRFDSELSTDSAAALSEIVDDFWRIHFYSSSSLFVDAARQRKWTRRTLLEFAKQVACRPFLTIIPEPERQRPDLQERLETDLLAAYRQAVEVWTNDRREIEGRLRQCQGLDRRRYSSARITKRLAELSSHLASGLPLQDSEALRWLSRSELIGGVEENQALAAHPFFEICESLDQTRDQLMRTYDLSFLALKHALATYVRKEFQKRNRRRNRRFFDDLLVDLLESLRGGSGTLLKETIRRRYRAVLIDEFQDTDPVQYAIFDSIYKGTGTGLFLIGDPKQAIYSFRGADLFAYLTVARGQDQRFTLEKNWRSTRRLVKAVNTLFQKVDHPFVFPDIAFSPVSSAEEGAGLSETGKADPAPLKVWFFNRDAGARQNVVTKQVANQVIPEAVASEVVRLLQGDSKKRLRVEGRPLLPRDIAVLVRTNLQAQWIQEALRKRRVPSVLSSSQSVFGSPEALEVERLLVGVADCGDERRVRAALATDLLGLGTRELACLNRQEEVWDMKLKAFSDYRDLWLKEGFVPMTRVLMAKEGIRSRLLAFPDGERRLTNVLHLFELLHDRALGDSLGMEGLLKWLGQQRKEHGSGPSEEHQIRLESDDPAVTVVTVHRSKGLEYSVVFCPFCWDAPDRKSHDAIFHDRRSGRALMDVGSEKIQENQRLSQEERRAEEARLLYVAVTRAKVRCTLIWGALRGAERSALAGLLHPNRGRVQEMTDAEIWKDLEEMALQAEGSIEVTPMPEPTDEVCRLPVDPATYQCRHFSGRVAQRWGVSSFSSLVSGGGSGEELPDRDASTFGMEGVSSRVPDSKLSILDFPRGLQAGIFFHELLEAVDFSLPDRAALDTLVKDKLVRYGFDQSWNGPVSRMILQVLATPLRVDPDSFALAGLKTAQRLQEMPFSFSSEDLNLPRLQEAFLRHLGPKVPKSFPAKIGRLGSGQGKTLMKGFIDLVFQRDGCYYLIDWKSNFLGDRLEDYSQSALAEVMERNWYFLQYHLYALALHRHLAFRLPGYEYQRDFGGVFYCFIRGIDPARGPEFGIYADRPSQELILELDRCLMPGATQPQQASVRIQQSFDFRQT